MLLPICSAWMASSWVVSLPIQMYTIPEPSLPSNGTFRMWLHGKHHTSFPVQDGRHFRGGFAKFSGHSNFPGVETATKWPPRGSHHVLLGVHSSNLSFAICTIFEFQVCDSPRDIHCRDQLSHCEPSPYHITKEATRLPLAWKSLLKIPSVWTAFCATTALALKGCPIVSVSSPIIAAGEVSYISSSNTHALNTAITCVLKKTTYPEMVHIRGFSMTLRQDKFFQLSGYRKLIVHFVVLSLVVSKIP